jgi:restriction endonuclease S subunit
MSDTTASDWEWKLLSEVIRDGQISLGRGDVISKIDIENHPGDYPIYSSSASATGMFGRYGKYMFDEELITWSVDGGGKPFYRPKHKFSVTNVCGFLKIRDIEKWDYRFVAALMQEQHRTLSFDWLMKAHPSVIRNLYRLPILPIREQQRIAEILDNLGVQIHAVEQIIAKLKLAKQGLASDLLPLDGNTQVEVRPLRELADISGGVTLGSEPSGPGTIRRPYLRVANVQDGHLDLSEIKFIRIRSSDLARYSLEYGDVLMNEGGDADKLGRGTVWENQIEGCLHQNHVFRVRADRRVLEPWFLAHVSASAYGKKYFLGASKQTTNLATINSTQIGAFPIPLPSVEEQRRIVEILSSHDALVAHEQTTLKKLYGLKTGLMSDLLSGRVRVPLEAVS